MTGKTSRRLLLRDGEVLSARVFRQWLATVAVVCDSIAQRRNHASTARKAALIRPRAAADN